MDLYYALDLKLVHKLSFLLGHQDFNVNIGQNFQTIFLILHNTCYSTVHLFKQP